MLAAIIGALAFGSLFFALGAVFALYAIGVFHAVKAGDHTFTLLVALITSLGVVVGAWVGARVFRWLASPRETELPTRDPI